MLSLALPDSLTSAYLVFHGQRGDVTRLARRHHLSRQQIYRQAHHVRETLHDAPAQLADLRRQLAHCQRQLQRSQRQLEQTRQRLRQAHQTNRDRSGHFAALAQARGVSLGDTRALLAVFLGKATPSRTALGRMTQDAARRATAALEVLDPFCRLKACQVAADEIFAAGKPILMTVEQQSLCWLSGRLAPTRDGKQWEQELQPLRALEQLTADGALGIHKALATINAQRHADGLPLIAEQRDHFHALQRARRAVREAQHRAEAAYRAAEKLQERDERCRRRRQRRNPAQGRQRNAAWQRAEAAFDEWWLEEAVFKDLRAGLRLFTPEGDLNTVARAERCIGVALEGREGPEWNRARSLLGKESLTFLEKTQQELAALPVEPALREAALRVEGLSGCAGVWEEEGEQASARQGLLVMAALVLWWAGKAGREALALVRGVLGRACRCSSVVEGLNSVLRMHQSRQKRLSQPLLDLKRFYWNTHRFRAGKRKGKSPYQGLALQRNGNGSQRSANS